MRTFDVAGARKPKRYGGRGCSRAAEVAAEGCLGRQKLAALVAPCQAAMPRNAAMRLWLAGASPAWRDSRRGSAGLGRWRRLRAAWEGKGAA